jgi:hypothetical protein
MDEPIPAQGLDMRRCAPQGACTQLEISAKAVDGIDTANATSGGYGGPKNIELVAG